jgi:hypothetical protein
MKISAKTYSVNLIAAAFIFLFTYTSLSKFMAFFSFQTTLHQSPLINNQASVIAWLLPFTELIVSLLLFIPATRMAGFYSSFLLMSVFTLYIGYMLLFTPHLPCSCGGVLKQLTWKQHLLFNIFFTILAVIALRLQKLKRIETVLV